MINVSKSNIIHNRKRKHNDAKPHDADDREGEEDDEFIPTKTDQHQYHIW